MRRLDVSPITAAVGFPVKSGTAIHIQQAYIEAISEAIKGYIGASYLSSTVYILNGLVNSGTYPAYNVTAGSVFWGGEVFLMDAFVGTATGSNVAVMKLDQTFFSAPNADGVEFTDGVVRNVHAINKMKLQLGLGGSGFANYSDFVKVNANIPQLNLTGTGIATVTGTYPNKNIDVPNNNKVLQSGVINIGDLASSAGLDANTFLIAGSNNGISGYRYIFPVAPGVTTYLAVLMLHNDTMVSIADFDKNYGCSVQTGQCTATDMYFAISTAATSNVQALKVHYMLISTA